MELSVLMLYQVQQAQLPAPRVAPLLLRRRPRQLRRRLHRLHVQPADTAESVLSSTEIDPHPMKVPAVAELSKGERNARLG
jgi:hypothetical protein